MDSILPSMGAWGHESFANDFAADFVAALLDTDDLSIPEEVFDQLFEESDQYVPMDLASEAIAACEVIARLRGAPGRTDATTEAVDSWVLAHRQKVPSRLVRQAIKAIDRILDDDSELRELWEEGAAGDAWKTSVLDLRRRLSQ